MAAMKSWRSISGNQPNKVGSVFSPLYYDLEYTAFQVWISEGGDVKPLIFLIE